MNPSISVRDLMAWILVTITGGELFEPDKSDSPRIRVVCCETGEENEAKTSALSYVSIPGTHWE